MSLHRGGRPPLVVVDLMSHERDFGPRVVAAHHRYTDPSLPLRVVGPGGDWDAAFEGAGGIEVTGSVCMLDEDAPWAGRLSQALEDAARTGVPVLGVCFGHQMLGVHFGSALASWEKAKVGVKTTRFAAPGPHGQGPFVAGDVDMLYTHRDRLTELGPGLEAVAEGGYGGVAAFRHRDLPIWCVQGHPEADAVLAREAEGDDVAAYSDAELDTPAAKGILARFGRLVVAKTQVGVAPNHRQG